MKVVRFNTSLIPPEQKIPNMGWNEIQVKKNHPIFKDLYFEPRYYFVHSYHFKLVNPQEALCTTQYGYDFVSGFCKDNIIGVQFHPEKSHKYGMKLMENFVKM
jgi:glutamine amidotransferase